MLSQWFPEKASAVARQIDGLFWYSTAWTAGVGLLVIIILGFFLIRYRQQNGRSAFYTHGDTRGALLLTLFLAAIVFVLLDMNLAYHDHLVWEAMFNNPPKNSDVLHVEVMPEQFAWNVRYPGADGLFGTADDIVTINELHVPVGKPVVVQLTSKDVIHSFFLPDMRIKQDAIPGMVTSIYFLPDMAGQFNIACAQHCGLGHYRMKGSFVVEEPTAFQAWLATQAPEASATGGWAWDWQRGLSSSWSPGPKKES